MSRCFPFPPPGYESKPRADDDAKLIIKEKKQKKHKDKKDKDKKEKKHKEKDRSEGKTKDDKKRKREKHKDKEKKKDKVSLEEKKVVGTSENQKVEKLVPDNRSIDRIEDKRTSPKLGYRVRNDGASDNKMVRKITFVEKSKVNIPENSNGRTANGPSVIVDAKNLGNGLVENCYEENNNNVKGGSSHKVEKRNEGKERNSYKKRISEVEGSEKEKRNNNAKAEDKRTEEKKEKVKLSDFDANNPSDLVKEDLNVFSHENGIAPNNLLCHQAGQVLPYKLLLSYQAGKRNGNLPNNTSKPALPYNHAGQNGSGIRPPQSIMNLAVEKKDVCTNQKTNGKLSSPQSVIKKAKKSVTEFNNGCISSHLVHIRRKVDLRQTTNGEKVALLENGGKMIMQGWDAAHTTNSGKNLLSENGAKVTIQEPCTVKRTNSKELRMNGTSHGEARISSKTAKIKLKEKIDASMKPPHPDLKFLGQILSIPQVECAPCDDDQEWLFGCKDSQVKRPKLSSPQNIVWAEAMMLEPVDVTALPYVIPY